MSVQFVKYFKQV